MSARRSQLRVLRSRPAASQEEAAALVAALEQMLADAPVPPSGEGIGVDGWRKAALIEGVSSEAPEDIDGEGWINT